jgi:hypothetical protein
MQTVIKEYIRDEKTRQPRGVVIAVRNGDEVRYGFSLLNTVYDRFNKADGLKIAMARAMADSYQLPKVPERRVIVLDALTRIQDRAIRYFKDVNPDNIEFTYTVEEYQDLDELQ